VADAPGTPRPPASRWTSFIADSDDERPRILSEQAIPPIAQARRQLDAAQDAYARCTPTAEPMPVIRATVAG